MGLAEKRKIKEYQDTIVPNRQKELHEISGATVTYDVDWTSFDEIGALTFLDNLSLHRTSMAFRAICIDELGKESLRETLKTVKLKNVKTKPEMKIHFAGGVLEMHLAYALGADGMYGDNEIKNVLMAGM